MTSPPETGYLTYSDHDREITFRWDGSSPYIEMHSGGLVNPTMEQVALQGVPYDIRTVIGWLRWFESICVSHLRMLDAQEESDADLTNGGLSGADR